MASDVVFTSFTSLTCDDHGSDESTGAYAADPYLYLYNDSDVLLFQDDDGAAHNDGSNLCWDSHIAVTNLAAGDYVLKATVYEDVFGAYSLDVSGVAVLDDLPTTTTTTTSTSTTTTSTTSTTSTTTTSEVPPETTTTTSTTTTTTSTTTTVPEFTDEELDWFDETEEWTEEDWEDWEDFVTEEPEPVWVEPVWVEPEPEWEEEEEWEVWVEDVGDWFELEEFEEDEVVEFDLEAWEVEWEAQQEQELFEQEVFEEEFEGEEEFAV